MKTINATLRKSLKTLLLATLLAPAAQAQTAANWNFNSTLSATPGSNLAAPNAALGSSIVSNAFNGGGEFYGEGGWPTGGIDPNAYLQFSVSPNTGYFLVLNTVTLVIRRSNTGTPQGAGPNNWTLRSSLDGYTSDLATGSQTINYQTFTITLPAAFQTLTGSVSFRLYGYNTTINSGGLSRFVYDNISIQGQAKSTLLAQQSIDLTAKAGPGGVSLSWLGQGLTAGTRYTIERASDGTNFSTIGYKTATDNDGTETFTDATATSARAYYRILAEQPDGSSLLSSIVSIALQQTTTETAIRSIAAAGGSVRTTVHFSESGRYMMSIWAQDGKPLYREAMNAQAGDQTASIAAGNYPHGVYILTLSKDGINTSRQFVY